MIENNVTAIVIALAAVLGLAIALVIYLFLRVRRIESECDLLTRGTHGKNFVEIVNDNIDQVHGLLQEVDVLSEQYAGVLRRMAGAVQHIGVVRYDAFRDMGGMMSFSVALLDDRGNGLTMSSIYGRTESRTYSKPVVERSSSYELSPEEKEAIRLAMQSKEYGALPVVARDREHEERLANLRLFHERELESPGPEEPETNAPERSERARGEGEPETRRARPAGGGGKRAPTPEEPKILGGEELLGDDYPQRQRQTGRGAGGVSGSRPRGLNTPVERLRDREPGRE